MSNDDLSHTPTDNDEDNKTTQPTITAVFRLLREVEKGQKGLYARLDDLENGFNSRLDGFNSRLDDLENGFNSRLDGFNARLDGFNARLDGFGSRLDEVETRLAGDIAGVDTRFVEMSNEMKNGFMQLADKIDRSRLHAEADYHDLLRRMRELESKAS